MAYYTSYRLTSNYKDLSAVKMFYSEHFKEFIFAETGYSYYPSSAFWEEQDDELKWHSTRYPDTLFILEGFGEDNEDMWKKYFMNGKMYRDEVIISFPDFDETKLT